MLSVFAALLVLPYLQIKLLTAFIKKFLEIVHILKLLAVITVRLQKENAMDLELRDPYLSFKKSSCMISSNFGGSLEEKSLVFW